MRVRITGFDRNARCNPSHSKIPPIKAIRTATGLALRECKNIVDDVEFPGRYHDVLVPSGSARWLEDYFGDHGVLFTFMDDQTMITVRRALSRMPSHMTVAEVLQVVDALGV